MFHDGMVIVDGIKKVGVKESLKRAYFRSGGKQVKKSQEIIDANIRPWSKCIYKERVHKIGGQHVKGGKSRVVSAVYGVN